MFNKSNEIINCGIYLRVSTANQAKNGVGLEDQLKKCKAMACLLYTSPSPRDRS